MGDASYFPHKGELKFVKHVELLRWRDSIAVTAPEWGFEKQSSISLCSSGCMLRNGENHISLPHRRVVRKNSSVAQIILWWVLYKQIWKGPTVSDRKCSESVERSELDIGLRVSYNCAYYQQCHWCCMLVLPPILWVSCLSRCGLFVFLWSL